MVKRISIILIASAGLAAGAATAVTNSWDVDLIRNTPAVWSIWRGDTLTLAANLRVPGITNAVFYWQSPGMGSLWWERAAAYTSNGTVAVTWTPAMDSGAETYSFFFRAGDVYRPRGTLIMQASPGAVPNQLPLPTPSIDFSLVEIKNAPWLTAEHDPVAGAALAGHTAASNPHGITAEGIGALPVRLNAYTYNVDDGYWLQLHSPWQRALLTTSTLQFFMGSTMTLGLDSDRIRINGRNYFWPAKAQDETLLTSSDIFGLASKSYVDTTFPTKSYVENTRWSADDIATNLSYNVVVSNGHWIIRESLK